MSGKAYQPTRKLFARSDLYLISALLIVSLLFFLGIRILVPSGGTYQAVVSFDGTDMLTVQLHNEQFFSIPERPDVIFEIRDNSVAFISSDCPDKLCIHAGFIRRSGQSAACLPNRLMLRITSVDGTPDEIDAVVY